MHTHHTAKVSNVATQVREYYLRKRPFRVFHGSTNSTRILTFTRDETIDVSNFGQMIAINKKQRTAIVEPNVPMDELVKETLKHGLIPPVVPEFPGITVGGAIQGGGGESSSFKWGFVSQATNWQEYILADGAVVKCSPDENADLFYGGAGSCGSLGILTAAEINLVPAKRFVELTYIPVASYKEALATMRQHAKSNCDFIDAILFGPDHGMVVVGKMTNNKTGRLRRFSRARDQWYYLHVQALDKKRKQVTETVPLIDYLFRYDRGAFWVGKYAFDQFGVKFTRTTRMLLDPLLHTRKLYQALQESGASQEHIVQDLTLPLKNAALFLEFLETQFGIYPLWLCPIKPAPKSPLLCNGLDTSLAINIGVWGPRIENYNDFILQNRLIEKKLYALGGKKWLYAHAYYTPKEFWQTYDKEWYTKLRKKYNAENLPDIYAKVHVRERYEINAKRGLLRTISGAAKLRIK